MNLPIDKNTLGVRDEFHVLLDLFLGAWATFEMTLDFAIGKFLQTSHEQTHLITAGMAFGKRAKLLADLVSHNDHPRKAAILSAFNRLCGMSQRDFVHFFLRPNREEGVHVLQRSADGRFKIKSPGFAKAELMEHLRAFAVAGADLYVALGVTDSDIQSFGAAAESLGARHQTTNQASSLSAAE